jgi:hypothetical protein
LNAPSGSHSAKAFLNKHGAVYAFTEHHMEWQKSSLETVEGLTLRKANVDDLDMRVRLSVEAFGMAKEDALSVESLFARERGTDILMIDVNEKTVGKICVKRKDGQAWIYGFSILPEHQAKDLAEKCCGKSLKIKVQMVFRYT